MTEETKSPADLLAEVTDHRHSLNQLRLLDQQRASASQAAETSVWDRTGLLELVAGDEELVGELVTLFLKNLPQRMDDLDQAVRKQDSEALKRAAHAIKGMAANISGLQVADAARALEEIGRSGHQAQAKELFIELHRAADRLTARLAQEIKPE
jgi:HPt (histidine-containing phosphotransfer) domain-containing protein